MWIGLSDGATEGVFRWTDTTTVSVSGWSQWLHDSNPAGGTYYNCVREGGTWWERLWWAVDCQLEYRFVCMEYISGKIQFADNS